MSAELLATTEKLDGVVSAFSEQLQDYINKMREELKALMNAVGVLGGGWQDSNYQAFTVAMNERMANINASLEKSDRLKAHLDEMSVQYHQLMELLRLIGE